MSDTFLNPAFPQSELDLLKSQNLDELKFNLTQPGFLAGYVASVYSFNEHPVGGTPESIGSISRSDLLDFFNHNYKPERSVIIFSGDISQAKATELAEEFFGKWSDGPVKQLFTVGGLKPLIKSESPVFKRLLVVDLPSSGQASVSFFREVKHIRRNSEKYYLASALNSLLGGGYSSRLNQEIRIKRGLSYGAGSNFGWRSLKANFAAQTQTKNESAAEVAQLIIEEILRLSKTVPNEAELLPRKSVLIGSFGRSLETTQGLSSALAELYDFYIPTAELNSYTRKIMSVKSDEISSFASENLMGGDIIIVGDYKLFKGDLEKRFPNIPIEVIEADDLDITKLGLRETGKKES